MQLDLFQHGRDVMLQNDVIAALRARDPSAVRSAVDRFAAEFPEHAAVAAAATLLGVLESDIVASPDLPALAARVAEIDAVVVPAAERVLGVEEALRWLAPLWCAFARANEGMPFQSAHPTAHAGYLYLRGEDGSSAEARIVTIPSWWRIPVPLAWMAEARFRVAGLEAAWCLLVELAWMSAGAFRELAVRLRSPQLARLLRAFESGACEELELDCAWFPAWLLITAPEMASVLAETQPGADKPPERVARLLLQLLALEKQGRHADLVARRRALRDQHEGLYQVYMATR